MGGGVGLSTPFSPFQEELDAFPLGNVQGCSAGLDNTVLAVSVQEGTPPGTSVLLFQCERLGVSPEGGKNGGQPPRNEGADGRGSVPGRDAEEQPGEGVEAEEGGAEESLRAQVWGGRGSATPPWGQLDWAPKSRPPELWWVWQWGLPAPVSPKEPLPVGADPLLRGRGGPFAPVPQLLARPPILPHPHE